MKTYKTELHGRLLIVRSFVEGVGGKEYPKLLIDTGSVYTILSQEILEFIGCSPTTTTRKQHIVTGSGYEIVPVVSVKKFSCLGKTLNDFDILGHTLPFGTYVDGLLGMDFLSQFDLEIRPRKGVIAIK